MSLNVDAAPFETVSWMQTAPMIAIPVYQREYRWGQESCQQLLDDIRRIATAPEGRGHFIGSILAKVEDDGAVVLVDGQQRVTTLMLLIAAIRDLARREDDESWRELASITAQPGRATVSRLRPHDRYELVVDQLLSDTPAEIGETSFEINYAFFLDQLAEDWRAVWEGVQRLQHVTIELGADADAQQIFESLNSTGAALSDDELIHNYILIGRNHAEQLKIEREVWVPIEEATAGATRAFWRDYLVLTAATQPDFGGDLGIYRAFRKRFTDPRAQLTDDLCAEWVRYAKRYGVLIDPSLELDPEVREQLVALRAFESAPRPLMLQVYDDYLSGTITKDMFLDTSERLQSMFIRRAVVNLARDIGTVGTICRELRETGYPVEGIVMRTPEDPQVRLGLTHGSLPLAGYVLRRLQSGGAELTDLQVEHIYPQNPAKAWSGDDLTTWSSLDNALQAEYRTVLNTIGNLTLLEAPLNQGAGNGSFLKKKNYYARSAIEETRSLEDWERWDLAAIKSRTDSLVERFLETWTRSSDAPMDEPNDLVRIVDLGVNDIKMNGLELFEYADFEGNLWGEVHTVKQLFAKVASELWERDPEKFTSTKYGWMVQDERSPRKSYVDLPSGKVLYAGWVPRYLLEVTQDFVSAFGLDNEARVKMAESLVAPVE